MAGVAYNTSTITESTKAGHITYEVWNWQDPYCAAYNDKGVCIDYRSGYWYYSGSGSTGAKITGKVNSSNSVYLNGKPIAYESSTTTETWIADPPVPSNTGTTEYRNISPSTSGSSTGSVTSGSSKVYVNGKKVAMIGTQVTTGLGNTTTVNQGSTNVFIS